jgi:hypothetical protein
VAAPIDEWFQLMPAQIAFFHTSASIQSFPLLQCIVITVEWHLKEARQGGSKTILCTDFFVSRHDMKAFNL